MKTNEIKLEYVDNANQVDDFLDRIAQEPQIDDFKKEDWVGESIKAIYVKGVHCGYVSYSLWNKEAICLSCIYIYPEYRMQGIASATIRKLMYKFGKEYKFFYGFVHKDNKNAQHMYEYLGFKYLSKDARQFNLVTPNGAVEDKEFYEFGVVF